MSWIHLLIAGSVAASAACREAPDPRRSDFRIQGPGVVAQYDDKTGRLKRLEVDLNKNGKIDSWTYAEGTRIERIEIDRDEDGKLDRWEYYLPGNRLEKVGSSTRNDGVVDEWSYATADGTLLKVEFDENRDGRVDKWQTYDPPRRAGGAPVLREVTFDESGAGRPTRRLVYKADGSFDRSEAVPER